jgi:uncharacterized protein with FMN-binding domain
MRRAPLLVIAGTAAGFIAVLGFHTRTTGVVPSQADGGASGPAPSAAPSVRANVGPGAVRRALGASEQFGYGVLDVEVTVSGTRITDVSVPTLQVAEFTSQQICDQVFPMLRSEVLSAQSARIDGISGATFTSEAYAKSLQAALDQLHIG